MADPPPYRTFFHPTDLRDSSLPAFQHALALTVAARGALTIYHCSAPDEATRKEHWPQVRATLAGWGLTQPGLESETFDGLGVSVTKSETRASDPVVEIERLANRAEAELLVLATHARLGLSRMRHKAVATSSMRALGRPALFFPETARGVIDEAGKVRLERVLIAVDHDPGPAPAMRAVARLIATVGAPAGICREVHVGKTLPLTGRPKTPGWTWERKLLPPGNVDAMVTKEAVDWNADLIAMVSRGPDQLTDLIKGSMLEQILNGSPCPVLAFPAPS